MYMYYVPRSFQFWAYTEEILSVLGVLSFRCCLIMAWIKANFIYGGSKINTKVINAFKLCFGYFLKWSADMR